MVRGAAASGGANHGRITKCPPARAVVPLFAIHGESDRVVPLGDNSALLKSSDEALTGSMRLIVPRGQGRYLRQEFFICRELLDFVITRAKP